MNPNVETQTMSNQDIDLDAAMATLEALDMDDNTTEIVEEIVEPELEAIDDEKVEDDLSDLAPEDEAAVELATTMEEINAEVAAKESSSASEPAPAKAARASKTPSAPRQPRDVKGLDAKHFILTVEEPADLEANKIAVLARKPAQVKVAEKFDNVLLSIAAEKKPSVYVMQAFAALSKTGEITSNELVKALTAHGMNESTARSQSGQIMGLFPALKIADRDGRKLTLRSDSLIAAALKILAA